MRAPVEKYDVKVSTSLSVYCWLQFGLTLILYEALVPLLNVRPSHFSLDTVDVSKLYICF